MTQSETELNQAMCEWRGWTEIKKIEDLWVGVGPVSGHQWELPNHIDDISSLGHVHEAENELALEINSDGGSRMPYYYAILEDICFEQNWPRQRATAKQRTIALLTVVNPEFIKTWKQKYPNE
jgi:hypothetical protein